MAQGSCSLHKEDEENYVYQRETFRIDNKLRTTSIIHGATPKLPLSVYFTNNLKKQHTKSFFYKQMPNVKNICYRSIETHLVTYFKIPSK